MILKIMSNYTHHVKYRKLQWVKLLQKNWAELTKDTTGIPTAQTKYNMYLELLPMQVLKTHITLCCTHLHIVSWFIKNLLMGNEMC